MRRIQFLYSFQFVLLFCFTNAIHSQDKKRFTEDWKSIEKVNPAPDWFKDSKLGIYAHWGPVSSVFEGSDPDQWYAGWHGMKMYEDGTVVKTKSGKPTSNNQHHNDKYGDPKEFGYKHVIEQFETSGFDAKEWADLFEKSGAKFAGPVAMHHDNFAMWDSKVTRWNSMNYGGIDPSAALKKEIESRGMKFMGSFHHAFTWKYFAPAHAHGGINPKDYDLYTNPHSIDSDVPDAQFYKDWWAKLKEYIDVYQPDLIWFDWWLENMTEESRLEFLAYYYNKGLEWNKEVVVCYKEATFTEATAVKDYERGRPNQPKENLWLTDTSPGAWFYRPGAVFKTPNELIDVLIDIVSKNGVMLLNVPPNPDGSIPQVMADLLIDMGAWLKVNGEAIYGTRPWTVFGEGPTRLPEGGHKVEEKVKIEYTNTDIRFTKKSDKEFFAIVMDTPKKETVIKTLSTQIGALNSKIVNISLLGSDETINWERNEKGLVIQAPSKLPTGYAHAYKIVLEGYTENNIGGDVDAHVD
ncbi:alpha-L-fucosidase [Tamlana sp. 2_MG-2023]|uniref:alpha-L-fucosidase n=1 Tax=unclassified Tamlana TaxID=2614803 RepID=UPI0026E3AFE7|nr:MULTISPECIES: alpha-L-fucosidase [unclassified Tamlana]MDO6761259.1 alpha-L-fucosidase [Tamlana sp. 2_MG-2023]MDO6791742.1 alpha-L-fucosidase [Tamlana sp. 1_MG-2023]